MEKNHNEQNALSRTPNTENNNTPTSPSGKLDLKTTLSHTPLQAIKEAINEIEKITGVDLSDGFVVHGEIKSGRYVINGISHILSKKIGMLSDAQLAHKIVETEIELTKNSKGDNFEEKLESLLGKEQFAIYHSARDLFNPSTPDYKLRRVILNASHMLETVLPELLQNPNSKVTTVADGEGELYDVAVTLHGGVFLGNLPGESIEEHSKTLAKSLKKIYNLAKYINENNPALWNALGDENMDEKILEETIRETIRHIIEKELTSKK